MNKNFFTFIGITLLSLALTGCLSSGSTSRKESNENSSIIEQGDTQPESNIQPGDNKDLPKDGNFNKIDSISHIHGLRVDIKDLTKVYIATHDGLLLLKGDNQLYRIGDIKDDLMGFATHPKEQKTLFSSGHSISGRNIGFQKSEDGGTTWKVISEGVNGPVDFHAIAVSQTNPNLIFGWYGRKLQRSEDGGITWKELAPQISIINLQTDPKAENTLYASTPEGLQVSKDKGETWGNAEGEVEGKNVVGFAFDPQMQGKMTIYVQDEGIYMTSNYGGTLTKVDERFNGETILYVDYCKNDSNMIYVATSKNSVYSTMDGGRMWKKFEI